MTFSVAGRNAAVDGVTTLGTHLFLCEGDPGTTGANEDTDVTALAATWGAESNGEAVSTEVEFEIPPGGGTRTYTHFGIRNQVSPSGATFVGGGLLDESEVFSDNGGSYLFTATVGANNPA